MPPQVLRLQDHEMHLAIDNPSNDRAAARALFDEQIANIEQHLSWSRQEVDQHNQQIRNEIPRLVAKRREEFMATRNFQAQIGYPVAAGMTLTVTRFR
jgi:CRISPR/Cas system-associated endonuclease Cas1